MRRRTTRERADCREYYPHCGQPGTVTVDRRTPRGHSGDWLGPTRQAYGYTQH